MTLRALPWVGGKNGANPRGHGAWVASLLPVLRGDYCYCEPFFGMGGVLLQRPPARNEVVNDLDSRVVNWWRVVREQPDELSRLIAFMPKSREEHARAVRDMDDPGIDDLHRALAFTVVVLQSVAGRHEESSWGVRINQHQRDWRHGIDSRLLRLAKRLRNVQLENRDAVEVLARFAEERGPTVVYVDPPYADTWGHEGAYRHADDRDALADVLRRMSGKVGISGYGAEWDDLGWQRHEFDTLTMLHARHDSSERTEVLWTNYNATRQAALL